MFHKATTTYVSQSYNLIDLYFKSSVSNSREEGEWEMRNGRNEKWSMKLPIYSNNREFQTQHERT